MPWIPYTYDNGVYSAITVLWAIGLAVWIIRARRRRKGYGSYAAGAVVSFNGFTLCLFGYLSYAIAPQDFENGEAAVCQSNLRNLGMALLEYAEAHQDHFPPADKWATDIMPYLPPAQRTSACHCPSARSRYSYAFNSALGGVSEEAIGSPSETVLLF